MKKILYLLLLFYFLFLIECSKTNNETSEANDKLSKLFIKYKKDIIKNKESLKPSKPKADLDEAIKNLIILAYKKHKDTEIDFITKNLINDIAFQFKSKETSLKECLKSVYNVNKFVRIEYYKENSYHIYQIHYVTRRGYYISTEPLVIYSKKNKVIVSSSDNDYRADYNAQGMFWSQIWYFEKYKVNNIEGLIFFIAPSGNGQYAYIQIYKIDKDKFKVLYKYEGVGEWSPIKDIIPVNNGFIIKCGSYEQKMLIKDYLK